MTLQFHAYPVEDGGAQIADTIGKGLQNLGNTYVDYQKAKSNAARQAMLDKFMREEQMRKMKEYAYDYETPLISPNPTNAGPRVEPQPLLRQPGGSSLVDEWNRKMGGGSPRVPSFGGVQSNTDPYAGMSPEMARYAAIPGAKNREAFAGAQKIFGDPMERQAEVRLKNAQAGFYERRGRDGMKPPAGFRFTDDGKLEAIPGGPAYAKAGEKSGDMEAAFNLYNEARRGLMDGLRGTNTGPIAGRLPAFTSDQQVAVGAVAAMAPVLKQLFRVAGEGVFTDRDQQLLLDMIPTRVTNPDAITTQMENIDNIVRAKLRMPRNGGNRISKQQRNRMTGETITVYSDDGGQTWHP